MAEKNYLGVGPKNFTRTDDRIREEVCERLLHDPDVDASEIEVQVQDGQVILTGTADSRDEKWLAEDIAESVAGVKNVVNKLKASSLPHELRHVS
jgi:osmotically-inducible protein OsmY